MTKIGDIFLVNFIGTAGHEQSGYRPAIVVGIADRSRLLTVVPLSSNMDRLKLPFTYGINPSPRNSLDSNSAALVFQVTAASYDRMGKNIGKLDDPDLESVKTILRDYLDLN